MVRVTIAVQSVYIADRYHLELYRETRDGMLKGRKRAATLLVVAGLPDPRFLVRVGGVAAAS